MLVFLIPFLFSITFAADKPLASFTCFEQVSSTLIKLGVSEPWQRLSQNKNFTFLKSEKTAKQDFSAYLISKPIETLLVVLTPKAVIQHTFQKKNKCQSTNQINDQAPEELFTDLDFFNQAKLTEKFVIVLWSPHMSISIQEMNSLKDQKFAVPVVFALDPNADLTLAKSYVEKNKLTPLSLKKWTYTGTLPKTIEHFPTALFIKNGNVTRYVPGFNGPMVLNKLIKDIL